MVMLSGGPTLQSVGFFLKKKKGKESLAGNPITSSNNQHPISGRLFIELCFYAN